MLVHVVCVLFSVLLMLFVVFLLMLVFIIVGGIWSHYVYGLVKLVLMSYRVLYLLSQFALAVSRL